ncbi:hypothetical protein KEM63_07940 [Halopseudomonas nanhaiensis]|uniref:hypothetical protein n=1 Tax=Halopseudomonas nanhaiensis TaxID=2830842 RepID=UPI001CC0EE94|nr:hypothetical protein [Halopseudomonas nanhaiensis]UAW99882.1 hypothetical protein KEM63_07940 [Halopseudomonas nanhaiensis]
MSDPLEERLRSLMRDGGQDVSDDDERLERVLHKAHVRGGALDLLTLFAHWGEVLSEAGTRSVRRSRAAGRAQQDATVTSRKEE